MRIRYFAATIFALSLVATPLWAQIGTGFTITDANVVFTQGNSPTAGTAAASGLATFRVTGPAGTNHLFENWWWYRVGTAATRELAFNSATGTVVGPPDQATTTWSFPEGFTAALNYNANSLGATQGEVIETMVLTNTGAAPITLNLFNYADFDMNATAGTDTATGGLAGMTIVDTAAPGVFGQFSGAGAGLTNYQVLPFAGLRTILTNAVVDNLTNTGLPFASGDFTGGFQWVITLTPGAPVTITERLAIIVPEPSTLALAGICGLGLIRRRR